VSEVAGVVLIAGVNGKMGRLLAARLADAGLKVAGVDLQSRASHPHCSEYHQADLGEPGLLTAHPGLFGRVRWCILCLPEDACVRFLPLLLEMVSPGTLIVDTMSVKTPVDRVYDSRAEMVAGKGLEILGINPLFSPELGFPGHTTLVVRRSAGDSAREFLRLLSRWQTRVVIVDSAAEHDERMALVQGLTHATVIAFGLTLRRMGYRLPELLDMITPPHSLLLSALARTVSLNPEVYWDIQQANPHAARVRRELLESVADLDRMVTGQQPGGFTSALAEVADCLQPQLPHLAARCADLFSAPDFSAPAP
jgi:prephenate dehydrogenase